MDYVCEQAGLAGQLSFKKMFGEYALYLDEKVIALVCDNQLFVKPTAAGKRLLGDVVEAPPYVGASLYFLVSEPFDDGSALRRLFIETAAALPLPKRKSTRRGR